MVPLKCIQVLAQVNKGTSPTSCACDLDTVLTCTSNITTSFLFLFLLQMTCHPQSLQHPPPTFLELAPSQPSGLSLLVYDVHLQSSLGPTVRAALCPGPLRHCSLFAVCLPLKTQRQRTHVVWTHLLEHLDRAELQVLSEQECPGPFQWPMSEPGLHS